MEVLHREDVERAIVEKGLRQALRALLNFGYAADARVARAIEWQARSITGERFSEYYKSGTAGPGFACVANGGRGAHAGG